MFYCFVPLNSLEYYHFPSMNTEIVKGDNLEKAIEFLKQGIPIAFPTETVYGLGASVFMPSALEKIFTIKNRPPANPLIAHVANLQSAIELSADLPESFFQLADRFWPGPLTLVVKKNPSLPDILSGGLPTIAIRMPSHEIARKLIEGAGPLAAPSANLSGRPSPTLASDVLEDLKGRIPLIVDGGECALGLESTVLSLYGESPILMRPGHLRKEELEAFLNVSIQDPGEDTLLCSPGVKFRHYAPEAKVTLVFHPKDLKGPYILSSHPRVGMRQLTEKNLYAELRRADRFGIKHIEIECCESVQSNPALMNRLLKAAGVN